MKYLDYLYNKIDDTPIVYDEKENIDEISSSYNSIEGVYLVKYPKRTPLEEINNYVKLHYEKFQKDIAFSKEVFAKYDPDHKLVKDVSLFVKTLYDGKLPQDFYNYQIDYSKKFSLSRFEVRCNCKTKRLNVVGPANCSPQEFIRMAKLFFYINDFSLQGFIFTSDMGFNYNKSKDKTKEIYHSDFCIYNNLPPLSFYGFPIQYIKDLVNSQISLNLSDDSQSIIIHVLDNYNDHDLAKKVNAYLDKNLISVLSLLKDLDLSGYDEIKELIKTHLKFLKNAEDINGKDMTKKENLEDETKKDEINKDESLKENNEIENNIENQRPDYFPPESFAGYPIVYIAKYNRKNMCFYFNDDYTKIVVKYPGYWEYDELKNRVVPFLEKNRLYIIEHMEKGREELEKDKEDEANLELPEYYEGIDIEYRRTHRENLRITILGDNSRIIISGSEDISDDAFARSVNKLLEDKHWEIVDVIEENERKGFNRFRDVVKKSYLTKEGELPDFLEGVPIKYSRKKNIIQMKIEINKKRDALICSVPDHLTQKQACRNFNEYVNVELSYVKKLAKFLKIVNPSLSQKEKEEKKKLKNAQEGELKANTSNGTLPTTFEGVMIKYIRKSNLRGIRISYRNRNLVISAPTFISLEELAKDVNRMLEESHDKILGFINEGRKKEQLLNNEENPTEFHKIPLKIPFDYVDGDYFALWGEKIQLHFIDKEDEETYNFNHDAPNLYDELFFLDRVNHKLYLFIPKNEPQKQTYANNKSLLKFLNVEFRNVVKEIRDEIAQKFKIYVHHVVPKNNATKYGWCNSRTREISLSIGLIQYQKICLKEVFYHEITHYEISGHTKEFYALLEHYMPNWREAESILTGKSVEHIRTHIA